jgi:GNAT superfamily N-acetyltransferase
MEANWAFTLREDGDLVAYGDITEDEVDEDAEITHLLVAPDRRGRGNGKALLSRLCAFLEGARPYREVWLRSPRSHASLLRAAAAVGFDEVPEKSGPRYLWLKKRLRPTDGVTL